MAHLPPRIKELYLGRYDYLIDHITNSKIFHTDQEITLLITLDAGCFEIGEHMMNLGGSGECSVDAKMLLNRIIVDKATKFIVAHNHPNGVAKFSATDIKFSVIMEILSNYINVQFLDHLLFAFEREPISLKKEYPKLLEKNWPELFYNAIKKHLPRP